jgi:hypothetical protein
MRPNWVLLFVFGIDRGNLSGMTDYRQHYASAKTPGCNLFTLIFSPIGMKKGWKRYINDLPVPSRFLYRDEFEQEYGKPDPAVPAVYIQSGKIVQELISAHEMNRIDSVDLLITSVSKKLQEYFSS